MVAPLQKLTPKANATIKDIGSIDSLVQSFGPYITGMLLLDILRSSPILQKALIHTVPAPTCRCGDKWCMICNVYCDVLLAWRRALSSESCANITCMCIIVRNDHRLGVRLDTTLQVQTLKMRMLLQRMFWILMAAHTTSMSPMRRMAPTALTKSPEPLLRLGISAAKYAAIHAACHTAV